MASLQNYVHGRAASPQQAHNGSHVNPHRQAIAANAKIAMRKGPTTPPTQQAQLPSGLPTRGTNNARNSSVAFQQSSHRLPNQGIKADPYDTDAESIDTTVNQSVDHMDEGQLKDSRYQQYNNTIEFESEEADDDSQDGSEQDEADDEYPLTAADVDFLEREGQTHLPRPEAVAYLYRARSDRLPVVEGDSYPTTTDGDPTETNAEGPEQNDSFPPSRPGVLPDGRSRLHQTKHSEPNDERNSQALPSSNIMFKQSAQLREQQRAFGRSLPPSGQGFQSSQPPPYSQATREHHDVHASNPRNRGSHHVAFMQAQPLSHQPQDLGQIVTGAVAPTVYPAPANGSSAVYANTVPVIRRERSTEEAPVQEDNIDPDGDYDWKVLDTMSYDALKNESFDIDPRAAEHPLSEDMRQRPLNERLEHVQKNLDPAKQSAFFRKLRTDEWEDAGDWFLDQFSSIIQRTKQARQQKRKLAQGFEDEIEKRYKHANKKQNQVEEAMLKMQAQGEGLVPRSPRPSKSPKPRKR